jgi:hypothetical protein
MKQIFTNFKKIVLVIGIFIPIITTAQTNFTNGNVAVFVAAASASNTTGSIVEFSTTGTGVVTHAILDGATNATGLRFSGSATSTCYLANSNDGTLLSFTGANSNNTASNVNTLNPRGVGSFNAAGTYTLPTTYTGVSGQQTRSASTLTNSTWFIGDQNGFYSNGTTAPSPTGNIRSIKIFGGVAYAFTSTTAAPPVGIISAATGGTFTGLAGLANGATSRQDFYLISSGSNGSTFDVLYVLDATSATVGTIFKYSLVSGSWTANGTYTTNFGGFGMAAKKNGAGADLFVSSGTGATITNKVVKLNDAAGYNTTINITTANNVDIYTAPTNAIIKGVAFAPIVPPLPTVSLSVSANTGTEAAQTVITVTATASSAVTGNQTVNLGVSGINITAGDYTLSNSVVTIPNGATTGSVTFTVADDAEAEATETAVLTISSPTSGITLVTPTTQNISIIDNDNTPPTIALNVATTTNYIDGGVATSPTSPFAISAVINDPTSPAETLGIDFAIADAETPVSSLTVTATSSNTTVVPNANIIVSGTGATRTLKITPSAVGYSTITVTVDDGTAQATYVISYAASAASIQTASTRFHTGTSDASSAIGLDNNFMLVADDENQVLRLYNRQNSGLPLNGFDFTSSLNLTDLSGGLPREVDIEASAKIGNRIYWLGSHSNAASGNNRPNRSRLFATDIIGSGAATTLSYVGRYDGLKTDLVAWDVNNTHGLGANYFGLAASTTVGLAPESAAGDGFNIEGLEIAPDGTTGYICFRAPIEPTSNRTKALIVPVTNFTSLVSGNPTAGPAIFGTPIQLNLGGRGIREIRRNANGEYLIIAGPHDGATGIAPKDFRAYTWSGNPTDLPALHNADFTALNAGGSFESIVDLPSTLLNTSAIQFLVDNGDAVFYNDGIAAKDLSQNNFKKFRSDTVVLGSIVPQVYTATLAGSPFCLSSGLSVPYKLSGAVNAGNVFTAQLSDASGSFASPVNIGSLNSTMATGTINAQIPATTIAGSAYRIRVIASNPSTIGYDNEVNFTITNSAAALATSNQSITQDVSDNSFEAGACVNLISNVFPNGGASAIAGNVTAKVWIESAVPTYNTIPFVQRHYEITPTTNATTATGTVTLYFTQPEFDNFNNDPASVLDLPTDPADVTGIANLRVIKYPGVSGDGTGLPGSYTSTPVGINPDDANIVWNAIDNRWEVSFDVTGFSGFFVQTNTSVLPLSLLSFNAKAQGNNTIVDWKSANEISHNFYEVLYSTDGRNFISAGQRNAITGNGEKTYLLTHQNAALLGNKLYYRLKMVSTTGVVTYSNIVIVRFGAQAEGITDVYPNPTSGIVTLIANTTKQVQLRLIDVSGKVITSKQININNAYTLDLTNYAKGVYILEATLSNGNKQQYKLVRK